MFEQHTEKPRSTFRPLIGSITTSELLRLFSKATAAYFETSNRKFFAVALAVGWTLILERERDNNALKMTGLTFIRFGATTLARMWLLAQWENERRKQEIIPSGVKP